jgi:antitoxin (DNA-binding transcriptional repressor) of toxin-antitoxin stability system
MTLVTLADACLRLPELIGLVAKGEHVVIVQNNVVLAELLPPRFQFLTPEEEAEEEAERRTKAEEFERLIAQWHKEDGLPYPPQEAQPERPQPESPAA